RTITRKTREALRDEQRVTLGECTPVWRPLVGSVPDRANNPLPTCHCSASKYHVKQRHRRPATTFFLYQSRQDYTRVTVSISRATPSQV
ncbi:MAG: hypothetical protein L0H94_02715, partial [Nitrospira sp.]|nr:hypothetical protein [Nitrospira sp.]